MVLDQERIRTFPTNTLFIQKVLRHQIGMKYLTICVLNVTVDLLVIVILLKNQINLTI